VKPVDDEFEIDEQGRLHLFDQDQAAPGSSWDDESRRRGRFPLSGGQCSPHDALTFHTGGRVRTIVNSRVMLIGLALAAIAGMTACSANRTPGNTGPDNGQTNPPAATAAASQGPLTALAAWSMPTSKPAGLGC